MENREKIERYLAHDLSPDDRLAFETELANNPLLQEMVGRERAAQAVMAQLRHDALIERMKQWEAEKKHPATIRNKSTLRWIILVILVVVLLGGYYYCGPEVHPNLEIQPANNVENQNDYTQQPGEIPSGHSEGSQRPKAALGLPPASMGDDLPIPSSKLLTLYTGPGSALSSEGVKGGHQGNDIFDKALSNLKNSDSVALNIVLLSAMETRGDADAEYRRQEILGHSYILLHNFPAAADCFKKNSTLSADASWYYHFCLAFDYEKNKKEVDTFISNRDGHPYKELITILARILEKR